MKKQILVGSNSKLQIRIRRSQTLTTKLFSELLFILQGKIDSGDQLWLKTHSVCVPLHLKSKSHVSFGLQNLSAFRIS